MAAIARMAAIGPAQQSLPDNSRESRGRHPFSPPRRPRDSFRHDRQRSQ
jgi:hypothetical protein